MKRRVLRPWIQTTLEIITLLQIGFFCCLEDFSMKALPIILLILASMVINATLLLKYSK